MILDTIQTRNGLFLILRRADMPGRTVDGADGDIMIGPIPAELSKDAEHAQRIVDFVNAKMDVAQAAERERLLTLAGEYLDLIERMRSGQYEGEDYQRLSSERSVTHEQLIAITHQPRPFDMERYCREIVEANRVPNV